MESIRYYGKNNNTILSAADLDCDELYADIWARSGEGGKSFWVFCAAYSNGILAAADIAYTDIKSVGISKVSVYLDLSGIKDKITEIKTYFWDGEMVPVTDADILRVKK